MYNIKTEKWNDNKQKKKGTQKLMQNTRRKQEE